jgi:lantibiotic modifying enzyme
MKIISWNTYLAPTMPNRFTRKIYVIEKVKEWIKQDIDIIALQELNDFTLGLFGYLYFLLKLYKYCNIFFQRFFDLLFIIEGILFPLF